MRSRKKSAEAILECDGAVLGSEREPNGQYDDISWLETFVKVVKFNALLKSGLVLE